MHRPLAGLVFAASLLLAGCDSGGPVNPDQVNRMTIRLENIEDSGDVATITAVDRNGDGRFSHTGAPLTLRLGADYNGTVEALETAGGTDLVAAIRADPDEYLLDYSMATDDGANSSVFATDRESDYDPEGREEWDVGLRFRLGVSPSSSSSGYFVAVLQEFESGGKETSDMRFVLNDGQPVFPVEVVGVRAPGR